MSFLDVFKRPASRQEFSQGERPKVERQYPSPVDDLLAELNQLESFYDYRQASQPRHRNYPARDSNQILDDRMTEIKRELLHTYKVIPMYKGRTWVLFMGGEL